jgi:hypothetical protein
VHKHSQADTPRAARASPSTTTGNTRLIGYRLTGIYGTAVGVALGEVNPPGEPGQRHLEGSGGRRPVMLAGKCNDLAVNAVGIADFAQRRSGFLADSPSVFGCLTNCPWMRNSSDRFAYHPWQAMAVAGSNHQYAWASASKQRKTSPEAVDELFKHVLGRADPSASAGFPRSQSG